MPFLRPLSIESFIAIRYYSGKGNDMAGPVRILIADDRVIFRDGLKALFDAEHEFEVVGEASNGEEALELTKQLRPDILLLDLRIPKLSGLEVLRGLAEAGLAVRTILLSGVPGENDTGRAFELGARGIVMKEENTETLLDSIRSVMDGNYWLANRSVSDLSPTLKRFKGSNVKHSKQANYGLTQREMQVIRAVVEGRSNKEIASQFQISEQTVKHHVTRIFNKLGVYNRLELTLFAYHHGLILD